MSNPHYADTLRLRAGDDWSFALTNLGALTGIDDLVFAIKQQPADPDDDALVLLSSDDGLERLNGSAATAAEGSITIDVEASGNITVAVLAEATVDLTRHADACYSVKSIPSGGGGTTLKTGRAVILESTIDRIA